MSPNPKNRNPGGWLSPLVHLSNNWLSLAGVVIVTTATVFWLFLLPITIHAGKLNPYYGILGYLVIPAAFFGGLATIPAGIWLRWRSEIRRHAQLSSFPPLTWRNADFRRLVIFMVATTAVNIVVASQLSYGAVEYMDSVGFCGQTCHTVMKPEFMAYQNSPHSRVECVKCHIGSGASWYVKSKLAGVGQVFAVAFNTHPRPIPTPVHNLRPARETCEACHWPQKYGEDRVRVISKFAEDEANSLTKTVLLMKIGGGNNGIGIHGTHLGSGVRILYRPAGESRQEIPWIEYQSPARKTVYAVAGAKASQMPLREMDCMDCHNRPSHTFELPERAVDHAMRYGEISPALPFAKKRAVEILKAKYASGEDAARRIPAAFEEYYRKTYPALYPARGAEIASSGKTVAAIFSRNVFPEMNVKWGDYPNNIGHTDFPGCTRCHDSNHKASDGKSIAEDCNACHNVLAMDEAKPKVLTDLGIVEARPPEQR